MAVWGKFPWGLSTWSALKPIIPALRVPKTVTIERVDAMSVVISTPPVPPPKDC